jgi:hypothetical protein
VLQRVAPGPGAHYLPWVARYMIAASRLAGQLPGRGDAVFGPPRSAYTRRDRTYPAGGSVLSPAAAALRSVHDRPRSLTLLAQRHPRSDAPLADEVAADTGHYLLLGASPEADFLQNCRVTEESAAVFEFLAEPRGAGAIAGCPSALPRGVSERSCARPSAGGLLSACGATTTVRGGRAPGRSRRPSAVKRTSVHPPAD